MQKIVSTRKAESLLTILTQIVCLELGSYPLNKHSNQMPITTAQLSKFYHTFTISFCILRRRALEIAITDTKYDMVSLVWLDSHLQMMCF